MTDIDNLGISSLVKKLGKIEKYSLDGVFN